MLPERCRTDDVRVKVKASLMLSLLDGRECLARPRGRFQNSCFSGCLSAVRTILFCAYNAFSTSKNPAGFLGQAQALAWGMFLVLSNSASEYESHQHRSSDRS